MDEVDFSILWRKNFPQVARYCHHHTESAAEAEEVCQMVAIRAWRHIQGLREKEAFLPWVLSIARREIDRWSHKRRILSGRSRSLPSEHLLPARETPEGNDTHEAVRGIWLQTSIDEAEVEGHLSPLEAAVLRERLLVTGDWAEVAGRLGINCNRVAVTHCRAIPKLRTFLFLARKETLGGLEAIRVARARAGGGAPGLTDSEAAVFDRVILRGEDSYRAVGWRVELRTACAKVAKYLPDVLL